MKRVIVSLLLCCSFAFVGCGGDDGTQKKLDELTAKIEQLQSDAALKQTTIEELQQETATQKEQIEGLENENAAQKQQIEDLQTENANQKQQIKEAKEGVFGAAFYTLEEAYNRGWLTQYDLLNIAYYYQGRQYNEDLIGEDFVPQFLFPLSEGEEEFIKVCLWVSAKGAGEWSDYSVEGYYGTYNGCIALDYKIPGGCGPASLVREIGGVNFWEHCDQSVKIMRTRK